MTDTGYRPLFSVHLRHGYFADGWGRGVVIRPTDETAAYLVQAGCLLRFRGSTLQCIGNLTDSGFAAFPKQALRFFLFAEDQAFATYTDVSDFERDTLAEFVPKAADLVVGGAAVESTEKQPRPLASIRLPAGLMTRGDLTLQFHGRSVFWRYLFVGETHTAIAQVACSLEGGAAVNFVESEPHNLANGDTAQAFVSDRVIDLAERSQTQVYLHRAGVERKERLPLATPAQLGYAQIAGSRRMVADIYVNQ